MGALYIGMEKIFLIYKGDTIPRSIADQPLFFLCLAALIIGSQLFLAGFIGEMISRNATERNVYGINKRLGVDE